MGKHSKPERPRCRPVASVTTWARGIIDRPHPGSPESDLEITQPMVLPLAKPPDEWISPDQQMRRHYGQAVR